jgi:CheY-like chemotaxis protein
MTKPVALIFYERLLPGSQLVNRLQDLGYRVQTVTNPSHVLTVAKKEKALFILMDLKIQSGSTAWVIQDLKKHPDTAHIPILGFGTKKEEKLQQEATKAGANLVALDDALLQQLPQLLDHLLQIE